MAISLKHLFQSLKADGPDATKINPSDWNEEHVMEMAASKLLGRTSSGTGPVQEVTVGSGLAIVGTSLEVVSTVGGLVGEIKEWAGCELPGGYLWCSGANVNRTTYSALLAAITLSVTGNIASGSATITAVNKDASALGMVGANIEGINIPVGATIASATSNTIVLSSPATGSLVGASLRIFPYGNGDGASTFGTPDFRGRASIGRDGMGGTAASRVTSGVSGVNGARLGGSGGLESHTLTTAQIPSHTHTGSAASGGASGTVTTSSSGSHTHTGSTGSAGSHTHSGSSSSAGAHSHTGSASAGGDHNHGGATSTVLSHDHAYKRYVSTVTVQSGGGATQMWQGVEDSTTGGTPSHSHTISSSGTHTHSLSIDSVAAHSHTMSLDTVAAHTHSISTDGAHTHTVSVGAHTHTLTIDAAGSGAAHNNVQPSLVCNRIIFTGV